METEDKTLYCMSCGHHHMGGAEKRYENELWMCTPCTDKHSKQDMSKAERISHFLEDKESIIPVLKGQIELCNEGIREWSKYARDAQKKLDNGEYIQLTSKFKRKIKMSDVQLVKLMAQEHIDEYKDCILRYEKYIMRANGVEPKFKTSFDVDRIKEEVLIADLMPDSPKMKTQLRSKYICPLHNEKTPSFTVYHDKNTFHCFGCQAGHSVIDLYMQLNNVDFVQACKELTNLYM